MDKFSLKQLKSRIDGGGDPCLVTYLNPYTYICARENWSVYKQFDRINVDGVFLLILLRVFLRIKAVRLSFDTTSEAVTVFGSLLAKEGGVFIVGSTASHIERAVNVLQCSHPDMTLKGASPGFFSGEEERQLCLDNILKLNPAIVVCGMGGLLQEQFLLDLKAGGWAGRGYTCGGYLHQLSMFGYQYYPDWADRLNLRWLYRMFKEPNTRKRYFIAYPSFVLKFFRDLIVAR